MILGLTIFLWIISLILLIVGFAMDSNGMYIVSIILFLLAIAITIFGLFNGFVNYPPTEGTHQGIITAVDLEGIYFRRYEIYLKSDGNSSNETKYLIYDYEKELAEQLKDAIGKKVKLTYGHDGGYIGWKNCGTYHIKSIEMLEE